MNTRSNYQAECEVCEMYLDHNLLDLDKNVLLMGIIFLGFLNYLEESLENKPSQHYRQVSAL